MSEGQGPSEREAIRYLRSRGCEVLNGGWPDLLVRNAVGRAFALELKAKNDRLRPSQMDMHVALRQWTALTVVTRRYDDIEDIPEAEDGGFRTSMANWASDLQDKARREGFEQGFDKGFEAGVDRIVGHRCRPAA